MSDAPTSPRKRQSSFLTLSLGMANWADNASLYFKIPTGRAVEVGM
ncbi:hypothetical protein LPW26_07080 [Rhodopseudomonas sp. HC1]|nr:hypothetical protein [Rhodopseudomonas infernalis]MCG6204392.1 hypothetical protein [Rhodopseudomonas infernalis]